MFISKINVIYSLTIRSAILHRNCYGFLQEKKVFQVFCERYKSISRSHDRGLKVYSAPLNSRLRSVKIFSIGTSLGALMAQPLLVQKLMEEGFTITNVIVGIIFQIFTFITPVLLHLIAKKYVREIYFNKENDEYTALTYSFWATDKLTTFKADDVIAPDLPRMFSSIIVKNIPLFIDANYFNDISHYKRIMGFDKPIDFKLGDQSSKT